MLCSTHQYALYEATHENFFTFFVEALPYLWILAFLVMVGVAVVNLRHTKRGYRKPVWFILASSVVLSFAGGSALQFFGLGNVIDHELGERIEAYRSMGKYEAQLWQAPEEGRLLGVQIYSTTEPEKTMIFRDVAGKQWVVNVAELHPEELEQLASGRSMRLIGVELPGPSPVFHSCGAFGWMYTSEMTTEQHRLEREKFVVRMYEHNRLEQDRRLVAEQTSFASTTLGATSVCADLAVVERLSF
jgi:hypothetical protein